MLENPLYKVEREKRIDEINVLYYSLLEKYVSLYQRYLNGDQTVQSELDIVNSKLLKIAQEVKKSNEQVKKDINLLNKNYDQTFKEVLHKNAQVSEAKSDLVNEKDVTLRNLENYIVQMKGKIRYQYMQNILYIVILIILTGLFFNYLR